MGKLNERDRAPYRRSWAQEDLGEIIRFAREGMTAREIAVETGIAENSVSAKLYRCLLYTSPSPRDRTRSRMPSSA